MQPWFFVLMAVGNEASNQMNDKIGGTPMTRMLNLGDVLELVNDGLDDGAFAQQQLIRQVHEPIFHVLTESGDEMQPLFKKQCGQGRGNVATVPKELATQVFDQLRNRCAILHVAWSQTAGQQFASVVDGEVKLEPKEPAHATLATPGICRKDAVLVDAFRITDFQ